MSEEEGLIHLKGKLQKHTEHLFWTSVLLYGKIKHKDAEWRNAYANQDVIIVIYVPMAERAQKPVYINNDIFYVWADEGWEEPVIEERFDPDRTVLALSFVKKVAKKTSDKKQAKKMLENIEKIKYYLEQNGESKTSDIAEYIDLSPARTRALLSEINGIEAVGGNSNRSYKLME